MAVMNEKNSRSFIPPRFIGFLMIAVGAFTGTTTYELLSKFVMNRESPLGIGWIVAGITWMIVDLATRSRSKVAIADDESKWFSPGIGGAVRNWPVWLCGIGAVIIGIIFALGFIKDSQRVANDSQAPRLESRRPV
jgi:hypothetical protein